MQKMVIIIINFGNNFKINIFFYLGPIRTRYSYTQYCNIAIERYCNKKNFFSKYCSYISRSSHINRNKYFSFTQEKKYWMKNVILLFYCNIFLSQYCVQKMLCVNKALKRATFLDPRKLGRRRPEIGLLKSQTQSKVEFVFHEAWSTLYFSIILTLTQVRSYLRTMFLSEFDWASWRQTTSRVCLSRR